MKIILLCAGYATRLYPLTKNRPKPLLPVGGRPILEWILDQLKVLKRVEAVYVVTNHRFARHFAKWRGGVRYPWKVEVIDDGTTSNEDRLGAIGDLNYVLSRKKIDKEDLLVIAGDNFFDFDLKYFVQFSKSKRPYPVIAVYDVKDKQLAKHYGLVRLSQDGKVTEFYEKPNDPPVTLVSCGIYWFPREGRVLLDRYLASGHNSDQPGYYMHWLAKTKGLFAAILDGRWLDIGDRASYDKANVLFRKSSISY